MGFIKAVDTYEPDKACFHTHLYTTVNGRLRNYINQAEVDFLPYNDNKEQPDFKDPEQECAFNNLVENLSDEAREVVNTVLNTPAEMIELVRTMTSNRQGNMHLYKANVTRFFRLKGWPYDVINSAYSEIRSIFN